MKTPDHITGMLLDHCRVLAAKAQRAFEAHDEELLAQWSDALERASDDLADAIQGRWRR